MVKAIIFDYGGVLIAGGGGNEPAESLAKYLDISFEKAAIIIAKLWGDFVAGKLTEAEYWQRVETEYGKPLAFDTTSARSTWENVAPLPEMMAFIDELRAKKYIVGLMSNITPPTESVIRAGGGYDAFDPCILSCKVGYAKPDPAIYQELLRQLPGIEPGEIVFIDDQQRYLDPALLLGIQTILARDSAQIILAVTKLLA